MELPNAYGPMSFEEKGEKHTIERTPGVFKIWKHKDGDRVFHMVDFSDGCYQAGLPVSIETLKAMRQLITDHITDFMLSPDYVEEVKE